jgi:pimeloyl-ACP methyl ester carboxylesterase
MSSPERFFNALNGPPPGSTQTATRIADCRSDRPQGPGHGRAPIKPITLGDGVDAGVTCKSLTDASPDAEASAASQGRPDLQFVSQGRVAPYVRFLESGPLKYHPGFDVFDAHHDWDSGTFPLVLCEFLAYKAALAYRSRKTIHDNLISEHPFGITDFAFFEHRSAHGDTQAYGFVLNGTAYLVFRGTEFLTLADWVTDFDTELTSDIDQARYDDLKTLIGERLPGRHTGFATAYGSVRGEIEAWATRLLDGRQARKIVFAGHSLGGALAILSAYDFAARLKRNHQIGAVVTFGAPMVGDAAFQEAYDDALALRNRTVRVAASLDLVTLLTLAPDRYRHVGRLWHLNKRPAYSYWRMYLFSPLWSPDEEAERKAKIQARKPEPGPGPVPRKAESFRDVLVRWALKALWFLIKLIRRAIASHSVNRNYALYLTVRSYQQLRRYFREDYDVAYSRLQDHLHYVRGRNGGLFGVARDGPIKVASRSQEEELARKFVHFIV